MIQIGSIVLILNHSGFFFEGHFYICVAFWPRDLFKHSIQHALMFFPSKEGFLSAYGLPKDYHGQFLSFAGQTLVKLNPNILVWDVERMDIQKTVQYNWALDKTK